MEQFYKYGVVPIVFALKCGVIWMNSTAVVHGAWSANGAKQCVNVTAAPPSPFEFRLPKPKYSMYAICICEKRVTPLVTMYAYLCRRVTNLGAKLSQHGLIMRNLHNIIAK